MKLQGGWEFQSCPHAHNNAVTARKCSEEAAKRLNKAQG